MEKKTKILLGLAAAGVVAYLVLKPKKVIAASKPSDPRQPLAVGQNDTKVLPGGLGGPNGGPIDVPVEKLSQTPLTKDCVQIGYDCTNSTYNTIQIPLDADCNAYQPAMPNCAGPRGRGQEEHLVPIDFTWQSELNS